MNPYLNFAPGEIKKQMLLMQEALTHQGECSNIESGRHLPKCLVKELHKKARSIFNGRKGTANITIDVDFYGNEELLWAWVRDPREEFNIEDALYTEPIFDEDEFFSTMKEIPAEAKALFNEIKEFITVVKEAAKKYDIPAEQAMEEVLNG